MLFDIEADNCGNNGVFAFDNRGVDNVTDNSPGG